MIEFLSIHLRSKTSDLNPPGLNSKRGSKAGGAITQGGKIEAKKFELDHACVRLERHHDVGGLQEEGGAAIAAPTTACGSTYRFA